METITEWISNNFEWVFGGIGVFVLTIIWGLFEKKKGISINQKQKSGNNSSNIQIGNINNRKDD